MLKQRKFETSDRMAELKTIFMKPDAWIFVDRSIVDKVFFDAQNWTHNIRVALRGGNAHSTEEREHIVKISNEEKEINFLVFMTRAPHALRLLIVDAGSVSWWSLRV